MKGHYEGRGWRETIRAEATAMSTTGSSAVESGSNGIPTTGARVQAQAWDPYDVWLKRVKQPRDRRGATTSR